MKNKFFYFQLLNLRFATKKQNIQNYLYPGKKKTFQWFLHVNLFSLFLSVYKFIFKFDERKLRHLYLSSSSVYDIYYRAITFFEFLRKLEEIECYFDCKINEEFFSKFVNIFYYKIV